MFLHLSGCFVGECEPVACGESGRVNYLDHDDPRIVHQNDAVCGLSPEQGLGQKARAQGRWYQR
jgi:hypothetical protein